MVKSQKIAWWIIVVIIALIVVCLLAILNLPKNNPQSNSSLDISDEIETFNAEVDNLQSTDLNTNSSTQNNATVHTNDGSPADVTDTTLNTYDRPGGEFDER